MIDTIHIHLLLTVGKKKEKKSPGKKYITNNKYLYNFQSLWFEIVENDWSFGRRHATQKAKKQKSNCFPNSENFFSANFYSGNWMAKFFDLDDVNIILAKKNLGQIGFQM